MRPIEILALYEKVKKKDEVIKNQTEYIKLLQDKVKELLSKEIH